MYIKSEEFAGEIRDRYMETVEYGFCKGQLVYLGQLPRWRMKKAGFMGKGEEMDLMEEDKKELKKRIKSIEGNILEQRRLLNEHSNKIKKLKEEIKKQVSEMKRQDFSLRELGRKLEPVNLAGAIKGQLYMEGMRSGKI